MKVHGLNMSNILMQVESEKDLMQWNSWFNTSPDDTNKTNAVAYYHNDKNLNGDTYLDPLEKITGFNKNDKQIDSKNNDSCSCDDDEQNNKYKKRKSTNVKHLSRQMRLDSGVTTHRLLDDDEDDDGDRRGSETTVATLDSCYNHPVVMASEYGMDEINHARAVQQQLQRQRDNDQSSISYSPSMILGSITDEEHLHSNQRPNMSASFYSSFAGYLSSSGLSTMGGVSDSEGTTAIATPLSISDIAEEEIDDTNSYESRRQQPHNKNYNL